MQSTSTTGDSRHGQNGFALIEFVLALAILALALAVAFPRVAGVPGPAALRASASNISALLRSDRNMALRSGGEVIARVDITAGIVESGANGSSVGPVSGGTLRFRDSVRSYDAGAIGIRFLPSGDSSGGVLTLSNGRAGYQVLIEPMTGRVSAPFRTDPPATGHGR